VKIIELDQVVADFERLIDQAAAGEAFVISRDGKMLVVVRPISGRIGFLAGEYNVPDDFDTMCQDEIERMFYGE
jgi:antitoxin (DNA-binding transcriptional repressor) of toxin-antitoxin stability system